MQGSDCGNRFGSRLREIFAEEQKSSLYIDTLRILIVIEASTVHCLSVSMARRLQPLFLRYDASRFRRALILSIFDIFFCFFLLCDVRYLDRYFVTRPRAWREGGGVQIWFRSGLRKEVDHVENCDRARKNVSVFLENCHWYAKKISAINVSCSEQDLLMQTYFEKNALILMKYLYVGILHVSRSQDRCAMNFEGIGNSLLYYAILSDRSGR